MTKHSGSMSELQKSRIKWVRSKNVVLIVLLVGVCVGVGSDLWAQASSNPVDIKSEPKSTRGIVRDPKHPGLQNGLISISKDGVYQYQTKVFKRKRSAHILYESLPSPSFANSTSGVSFNQVYGSSGISLFALKYEFLPFSENKNWGAAFQGGFGSVRGLGILQDGLGTQAKESYSLYTLPLGVSTHYRIQWWDRQWLLPVVSAGFDYFIFAEKRDDDQSPRFLGSGSAFAGGGLQFALTRFSLKQSTLFYADYGLTDLMLSVQLRQYQNLVGKMKVSGMSLSAGLVADF